MQRAGAAAVVTKDEDFDRLVGDRVRGCAGVKLTADNTAVVLDSTADFPDAPDALPELPDRPAVRPLRRRELPGLRRHDGRPLLRAAADRSRAADDLAADARRLPRHVRGARAGRYERILSIQISSTLSGTFASAQSAAELLGGDAVRVIDSRTVSAALAHARARRAAPARARHDRRGDRRVRRALPARPPAALHRQHARVPRARRPHRPRGGVRGEPPEREADPHDPRRRGDPAQARAREREGVRRVSVDCSRRPRRTRRTSKVGIAHAAAPERLAALRELVEHVRPHAEIEMATPLGPVVGTHAGPGTVGFFWYEDA